MPFFFLSFPSFISHNLPFLYRVSERVGESMQRYQIPPNEDQRHLNKAHNPPLNPSLQNHLHSLEPAPQPAAVAVLREHSRPIVLERPTSLTGPVLAFCLFSPLGLFIFYPLSFDFQTGAARGPEDAAFVRTSMLSGGLRWRGVKKARHMPNENGMD